MDIGVVDLDFKILRLWQAVCASLARLWPVLLHFSSYFASFSARYPPLFFIFGVGSGLFWPIEAPFDFSTLFLAGFLGLGLGWLGRLREASLFFVLGLWSCGAHFFLNPPLPESFRPFTTSFRGEVLWATRGTDFMELLLGGVETPLGSYTKLKVFFPADAAVPVPGTCLEAWGRLLPPAPPVWEGALDPRATGRFTRIEGSVFVRAPMHASGHASESSSGENTDQTARALDAFYVPRACGPVAEERPRDRSGEFIGDRPSDPPGWMRSGLAWGDALAASIRRSFARLRQSIALRLDADSRQHGPMKRALLVGDRAGLSDTTWGHFRDSGIAHLLAISGLHIAIVGFGIFTLLRLGAVLLCPGWVQKSHAKRWIALSVIPFILFYLILSGGSASTIRASVMAILVLIAIAGNWQVFHIRTGLLAAVVVLLFAPLSLLSAGFQLSFIAVFSLIWLASLYRSGQAWFIKRVPRRWLRRFLLFAGSSAVVSCATAPFAAWHFGSLPTYGLVTNLVAIPLLSFIVLPCLGLELLGQALGFSSTIAPLSDAALSVLESWAAFITTLPASRVLFSKPEAVPILLLAGVLSGAVFLYEGPLKRFWYVGALGLWFGLMGLFFVPNPPQLRFTGTGSVVVVHADSGARLYRWRPGENWVTRHWRRLAPVQTDTVRPASTTRAGRVEDRSEVGSRGGAPASVAFFSLWRCRPYCRLELGALEFYMVYRDPIQPWTLDCNAPGDFVGRFVLDFRNPPGNRPGNHPGNRSGRVLCSGSGAPVFVRRSTLGGNFTIFLDGRRPILPQRLVGYRRFEAPLETQGP